MNIIILVGIPGCGKSTVLKAVNEIYPHVKVVNYGEKMLQEAALMGTDRDTLRKMAVDKQQEIGLAAAVRIAKEVKGLTIVDTHASIKTEVGYCPGIPLKVLNALHPKALAMIQCAPQVIMERRSKDKSRLRDEENKEELSLHQELTQQYLVAASMVTGAFLCMIQNQSQDIKKNINPLIKLIQSLI